MKRWILIGQNFFPDEGKLYHILIGVYNSEEELEEAKKDNVSKYTAFMPFEFKDNLLEAMMAGKLNDE